MSPTEQLTPSQAAQLRVIRDKWIAIGLSTIPADRPRAEAAVRLAYRQAGLTGAVRIVWSDSPMSGACVVRSLMRRSTRSCRLAEVFNAPASFDRASNCIGEAVLRQIADEVVRAVAERVGVVWQPLNHHVAEHIEDPIPVPGYGQHAAPLLAEYDALGQAGLDVPDLHAQNEIAQSSGWWWPFDDVCVLTERPSRLAFDARARLHSGDGPAVVYPGGATIYAWHGVPVDHNTILHPELITLGRIRRERNVAILGVLLERYGFDRYLDDTGSIPIHADETGTLYRCDLGASEPLVLVSVENHTAAPGGSRRRFVLRVPPNMTEARQAVAWTFGMRPEDYQPVCET